MQHTEGNFGHVFYDKRIENNISMKILPSQEFKTSSGSRVGAKMMNQLKKTAELAGNCGHSDQFDIFHPISFDFVEIHPHMYSRRF